MNVKKSLLGVTVVVALAFAALPAGASALTMELPANHEFTVAGGETKLTTAEATTTCSSVSGSGKFETSETGSVKLLFKGCKASGTNCKSSGKANGEIETTTLPFHLATLKTEKSTHLLIVITPNEGHFATYTCAFGLVSVKVGGNGVIGEITSPGLNEASSSMTLNFETSGGTQVLTKAEVGGGPAETYELKASINGGAQQSAGQDGVGTATFLEGKGTLM